METEEFRNKMEEKHRSRDEHLFDQLIQLSMSSHPCDITFYDKPPVLNVIIDNKINYAIMYGVGVKELSRMLQKILLSNGDTISLGEIWTINPIPKAGFQKSELEEVDLAEAEEKIGPHGETLRKMISDTYHCKSKEEEDYYLRRFIIS